MKVNIEFATDAATGDDCVLHLSVSGTSLYVREVLRDLMHQIDGDHGKPHQGIVSQHHGTRHTITPIWNGKEY